MSLAIIGWLATAVFASSYLFRQPLMLRRIQAGAALLWVIYGVAIDAVPVVVANPHRRRGGTVFFLRGQIEDRLGRTREPVV